MPDSGSVQAGKVAPTAGSQGQNYLQLIATPPQPSWSAGQVVQGFLTACASFANNHAIARQYLDPEKRGSWNPGGAVTVVQATQLGRPLVLRHPAVPVNQTAQVTATGDTLATLTASGQYVGAQQQSTSYTFHLFKIGGQWRIENPPSRLLLTEPDFKLVYASRNLYYVAPGARALVPDPVFVPLQATSATLADKLVTALRQRPQGWLESSVSTAFPPGTVVRHVTINDGTATVDLGGSAAGATRTALSSMTSQLVWTLAGPPYGQLGIQTVDLEVNGHLRQSAGMSGGQQSGKPSLRVPEAGPGTPLYAVAGNDAVQESTGLTSAARNVPGAAGQGSVRLATIAVSPGGTDVAGFTGSGRVVYHGPIRRGASLARWPYPGRQITSLSWDASGNLWVAGSDGVWMLPPRGSPVPLGPGFANGSVSQLRVAPDGVRVAMIVHNPAWNGPRLLLAAIERGPGRALALGPTQPVGPGVFHPKQLTWYDANDLIVLSGSGASSQLWEVPVDGGSPGNLDTEPSTRSITAAGPANPVAAVLASGQLALTPSLNGTWAVRKRAVQSAVYPG